MKGKNFSTKEILMGIILLLLLGYLGYSQFFDGPIEDKLKAEADEQADIQMKIDLVNQKLVEIEAQKAELDLLGESGVKIRMPSYNAENMELNFLYGLVDKNDDIQVVGGTLSRSGDQVRRPVTITYHTDAYEKVINFITNLNNSEIRCLIDEVKFTEGVDTSGFDSTQEQVVYDVSIKATFYETMWDGVADQFLPADKSSTT